jgi:hypothetical protein
MQPASRTRALLEDGGAAERAIESGRRGARLPQGVPESDLLGISDLIPSAQACCLLTPLAVLLQAVFVLLPLTATRTVLSRVVSDPRARHRALLRREAGQAGGFVPSRARERKAAWKASSSTGRSWSSSLRAPCGGRAGAGVRRRTSCVLAIIILICFFLSASGGGMIHAAAHPSGSFSPER